jgi:predicted glutamine amidotransferase
MRFTISTALGWHGTHQRVQTLDVSILLMALVKRFDLTSLASFVYHANTDARLSVQGLRPAMYKTIQPPLNDMNFRSICANTETRVCFAHIRAASGGSITPMNNHPFVFGRHAFMHNGVVSNFMEIKREVCNRMSQAAYANVQGATDSEYALWCTCLSTSTEGNDEHLGIWLACT